MRLYEGCLVKIRGREEIFYIKGLVEENGKVLALPRYIPSEKGDRVDPRGRRYLVLKRFEQQINYVIKKIPNILKISKIFGTYLPMIDEEDIEEIYYPTLKLRQILKEPKYNIDKVIIELVHKLSREVPLDIIGIAGSRLADLEGPEQDIDLIVIDYSYTRTIIKILRELREPYNEKLIDILMRDHSKDIQASIPILRNIIKRRFLENVFKDHIYFVRILLMRNMRKCIVYRRVREISKIVTYCKIVEDNVLSYTTPSIHKVYTNIGIEYLLSDRGIFTDTLQLLESFKIYGKLEKGEIYIPDLDLTLTRWIYLDHSSRIFYP